MSTVAIVLASASCSISTSESLASPKNQSSYTLWSRVFSSASAALKTSSLKKTCLSVYDELMMMSIKRSTSTWNSCFSAASANFARSTLPNSSTTFLDQSSTSGFTHSLVSKTPSKYFMLKVPRASDF